MAYVFLQDGEKDEVSITYGQLAVRAQRIAAQLVAREAPGERALLLFPPGLDYIAAFFGCLYARVVGVPAYPPNPSQLARTLPRLQAIVADCQAHVALTTASIFAMADVLFAQTAGLDGLTWLTSDTAPPATQDCRLPDCADDIAFLQYTSGSTGAPKGVMVSNGNLMHNSMMIRDGFGHTEKSVGVGWLPLYHDMGLIGNVLQPLYVGFPCVLMSPLSFLKRPARWLQAISRHRATTSGGPNFAYDVCSRRISAEERSGLDLSSWQLAFSGAEPIRSDVLDRFATMFHPHGFNRAAFYPCYGLAEGTLIVSGGKLGEAASQLDLSAAGLASGHARPPGVDEIPRRLVSSGRVLAAQQVVIADPVTRTKQDDDRVGEIWVNGPSVARGYWGRPETTESLFHAQLATGEGPYLRTGDLGFLRDGQLVVTGRLKDLIIIRGRNIYPHDVEATVELCSPAFRAGCTAVFSVDVDDEERLVVVQELKTGGGDVAREATGHAELFDKIKHAVSQGHEVQPYAVVLVKQGTIPKTSSGKIQRGQCRSDFLGDALAVVAGWRVPPVPEDDEDLSAPDRLQTFEDVERWLRALVAVPLKLRPEEIDLAKHVTQYGFDSLTGVELQEKIESTLLIEFAVADIFETDSIGQLIKGVAERVFAAQAEHADVPKKKHGPIVPQEKDERIPLSLNQLRLWRNMQGSAFERVLNMRDILHLRGPLQPAVLERCIRDLLERHHALRMNFGSEKGVPYQTVSKVVAWTLPVLDLRAAPASERDDRVHAESIADGHRILDTRRDLLIQLRLLQVDSEEFFLLLTAHHLVWDEWSKGIFFAEMAELYRTYTEHRAESLPDIAIQYGDFALFQQQLWADEELRSAEATYWKRTLIGSRRILALPSDFPRPAREENIDGWVVRDLTPELVGRLAEASSRDGATVATVMLAALQIVVGCYTKQTDIVVGVPAMGRDRPETRGTVGYFVNHIAVRVSLAGNPTLRDMVHRARHGFFDAYAHQAIPLQEFLPEREVQPRLYQVRFNYNNFAMGAPEFAGLSASYVNVPAGRTPFDISFYINDSPKLRRVGLRYRAELFKPERMSLMMEHYMLTLEKLLNAPEEQLDSWSRHIEPPAAPYVTEDF